jgi:hypothetical protein
MASRWAPVIVAVVAIVIQIFVVALGASWGVGKIDTTAQLVTQKVELTTGHLSSRIERLADAIEQLAIEERLDQHGHRITVLEERR